MDDSTSERWLSVGGCEGKYEVSSLGRVKSYRRREPRILKPRVIPKGYARVTLGKADDRYIHLLVAEAFHGPCPEGMQCYFRDGDNRNITADNLAWGDLTEKFYTKGAGECSVCGRPLRYGNTSGVCSGPNATTDCKRVRTNLERAAKGLPPHKPAKRKRAPGEVTEVHAGDSFGFWTVLEDGRGVVNRVACRCECGTERRVLIGALIAEDRSLSCGQKCPARRAANPYLKAGSYGLLTVLEDARFASDLVLCQCKCGSPEVRKRAVLIKDGKTTSCGCRQGESLRTHGLSGHPLYGTWSGMHDRTGKPEATGYENYGGRGITVCERWQGAPEGFLNFVADMGPRPTLRHTLDRVDNDGNYEAANCRWATKAEQSANRRTVLALTRERDALLAEVAELKRAAQPARKGKVSALAQGALF